LREIQICRAIRRIAHIIFFVNTILIETATREEVYWKQGRFTEKDFIYTTTQHVTVEALDRIPEKMKEDDSPTLF
jgi:hypothetical protein